MLTIILPTYNRRQVLERTIATYIELSRRHEVLVIDDGSNDGTCDWLRGLGLRVIRHARRQGLPAARNTGLVTATSPWVLFGEDDVIMPAHYPDVLLRAAAELPRVGAVAGRLHAGSSWSLPDQPPAAERAPLLDGGMLCANFAAELARPTIVPSLHACALVRRSAALGIGGYDRRFKDSAFREESDFYARLWRAGFACWLTPAAWAVHVRHRLGGGCRGAMTIADKVANRWSYWSNNNRFLDRHWRMWRRWTSIASPGAIKLGYAACLTRDTIRSLRKRAACE